VHVELRNRIAFTHQAQELAFGGFQRRFTPFNTSSFMT
jgi:hypothetical protein